ncbi:DsbA family protein [Cyclonatronum proteinivorum]|nr:thioredoxin domain-containing protein [Cyclonatronum proteinivorum]
MSKKKDNTKKQSNPVIWFGATGILLVVALAVVYWAYTENEAQVQATAAPSASESGLPAYNLPNWIKGDPDSELRLVVFSDFGCIHCARFHTVIDEFFEEYGELFGYEMRHFPLGNNFHSRAAAVASIAAGKQGKFWEMVNLLYYNTDRWRVENPLEGFFGMAQFLELDLEQFERDVLDEDTMYNVVRAHLGAQEFGIRATPTAYLNGEPFQVPQNPQMLYRALFGDDGES